MIDVLAILSRLSICPFLCKFSSLPSVCISFYPSHLIVIIRLLATAICAKYTAFLPPASPFPQHLATAIKLYQDSGVLETVIKTLESTFQDEASLNSQSFRTCTEHEVQCWTTKLLTIIRANELRALYFFDSLQTSIDRLIGPEEGRHDHSGQNTGKVRLWDRIWAGSRHPRDEWKSGD